jgi:hypothetical protein
MGTGVVVAVALGAWALFRLDEMPRPAPDSRYYLAMARGEPVPVPFAYRPMVPALVGTGGGAWVLATCLGIVASAVGMAWLAGGGTRGLVAALLLLGLPCGARFSVRHPVLVDAPAFGLTLIVAALFHHGPWWLFMLPCLALVREQAPILLALLTGWPWLGLLVALPQLWVATFGSRAANPEDDNAWITSPWTSVQAYRLGRWTSLASVLPLGVVLPLAMMSGPWPWPAFVALALGYLPALRASDLGRCLTWAAPVLILLALEAPIPAPAWPVVVLVHWLNPYRGG